MCLTPWVHYNVLCTNKGKPIRPRNFRNTFDAILAKAEIKTNGMHVLRHSCASMLFRRGADIKTVSEILGHANIKVTATMYIHLIPEQKKSAISLLDL